MSKSSLDSLVGWYDRNCDAIWVGIATGVVCLLLPLLGRKLNRLWRRTRGLRPEEPQDVFVLGPVEMTTDSTRPPQVSMTTSVDDPPLVKFTTDPEKPPVVAVAMAQEEPLSDHEKCLLSWAYAGDHKILLSKPPGSAEGISMNGKCVADAARNKAAFESFKIAIGRLENRRFLVRQQGKGSCTYFTLWGRGIEIGQSLPTQAMPSDAVDRILSLSPVAEEMLLRAYDADRRICFVDTTHGPTRGPRSHRLIKIAGVALFSATEGERSVQYERAFGELASHEFVQQLPSPNDACYELSQAGIEQARIKRKQ